MPAAAHSVVPISNERAEENAMDVQQTPATDRKQHGGVIRPLLWLVLVVSAALNAVFSSTGQNTELGIGFGVVALAAITALIVHHYRHRRN
jgi:hypothetical protein